MTQHHDRYWARPELKERLVQIGGGSYGYMHKFRAAMSRNIRESEIPSISFLLKTVSNEKACPIWLVVEYVRYVERDSALDYDRALKQSGEWFRLEKKPAPYKRKRKIKKEGTA